MQNSIILTPRQAVLNQLAGKGKLEVPYSEIRHTANYLLGVKPLVRINETEKAHISYFTTAVLVDYWSTMVQVANKAIGGEMRIDGRKGLDENGTREMLAGAFSDWEAANTIKVECRCPRKTCMKPLRYERYRTLEEYEKEIGISVIPAVAEICKSRSTQVRILEVGSGDSNTLYELKQNFGDRIETHALSLHDEPRAPVDKYHQQSAELFPAEFAGMFDMVISTYTLGYLSLPHLGLRNIVHSLSKGGKTIVHFAKHDLEDSFDFDATRVQCLKTSMKNYLASIIENGKAIANFYGELLMGAVRIERPGYLPVIGESLADLRTTAWSAELGIIGASPKFEVKTNRMKEGQQEKFPDVVTIERKSG